jgi:hypothetical protein
VCGMNVVPHVGAFLLYVASWFQGSNISTNECNKSQFITVLLYAFHRLFFFNQTN